MKRWVDGISRDMTTSEAAVVVLRSRLRGLDRLIQGVDAVENRKPDAVRRVRAGTRRASAALHAFSSLLDEAASKKLRKSLKELRWAAAPTRAAEVALIQLSTLLDESEGDERLAVCAVLGEATAHERSCREDLVGRLREYPIDKLLTRKKRVLAGVGAEGEGSQPVVTFAARALAHSLESVMGADPQSVEALHELRVKLKRVRYTLELFRALAEPEPFELAYSSVCDWQERLGAMHDLADHVGRVRAFHASLDEARMGAETPSLERGLDALSSRLERERDASAELLARDWGRGGSEALVEAVSGAFGVESVAPGTNGSLDGHAAHSPAGSPGGAGSERIS